MLDLLWYRRCFGVCSPFSGVFRDFGVFADALWQVFFFSGIGLEVGSSSSARRRRVSIDEFGELEGSCSSSVLSPFCNGCQDSS